jgi:glycosyltransferase involved in cell wall biosynthesis
VDVGLPVVTKPPAREGRRPQVFWAGRWGRHKRVDLALEIAELMPDVDFRMWGESVTTGGRTSGVPTNVRLEGAYPDISSIALDDADAWLYTSAWDGVPSQLLEVAMTNIPIVGSLVGGTGEILRADDAWPVDSSQGADAYVAALREVLGGPAEARRRAAALRERMVQERSEQAFAARAADLLLTADGAR